MTGDKWCEMGYRVLGQREAPEELTGGKQDGRTAGYGNAMPDHSLRTKCVSLSQTAKHAKPEAARLAAGTNLRERSYQRSKNDSSMMSLSVFHETDTLI